MAISQVVAQKVNGELYNTVPPNAKGSGAGGNGGAASRITNSSLLDGVAISRYNGGVFGSTVLDNNHSDKALDAGTFAFNNQRPVAKRLTATISGTTNTFLQSGASVPSLVQSIHYAKVCGEGCVDGVRTRQLTSAIRQNKFNRYTAEFDAGYPVVSADVFEQDEAARPSRTTPGLLTYKSSSLVPQNDVYKPKTG
jgi:hypothetical protein